MSSSLMPMSSGSVSDQLSNTPPGPVMLCVSCAIFWARRSAALRSRSFASACRRSVTSLAHTKRQRRPAKIISLALTSTWMTEPPLRR